MIDAEVLVKIMLTMCFIAFVCGAGLAYIKFQKENLEEFKRNVKKLLEGLK